MLLRHNFKFQTHCKLNSSLIVLPNQRRFATRTQGCAQFFFDTVAPSNFLEVLRAINFLGTEKEIGNSMASQYKECFNYDKSFKFSILPCFQERLPLVFPVSHQISPRCSLFPAEVMEQNGKCRS